MKKGILLILLVMVSAGANAQLFKFGIKAGPNFSNFSGGIDELNYSSRTNFHAGVFAELKLISLIGIQPELLYSSQGAEVDGIGDFNLDYVSVPVMVKLYLIGDKLSLDAGPQFSFLIDEGEESFENESFDLAIGGGASVYITKSISASARYMAGLTEVSEAAEVRNTVFQISAAYTF